MMTEDLAECPSCGYEKALTHYSSDYIINWVACPKCRKFFDHDEEMEENDKEFWNHVEQDTGYTGWQG